MTLRHTTAVLLIAAAVLLAIGAFSRTWWTFPSGKSGAGLLGFRDCQVDGDTCESHSYAEFQTGDGLNRESLEAFMWAGRITFGATLLTALASGGLLLMGFRGDLTLRPLVTATAGATAIAALATLGTAPDVFGQLGFGLGFYVEWLGLLLAFVGATVAGPDPTTSPDGGTSATAPSASPSAPLEPLAPPPSSSRLGPPGPSGEAAAKTPVPGCPTCRAPTEWVQEHTRFYCPRCNVYL